MQIIKLFGLLFTVLFIFVGCAEDETVIHSAPREEITIPQTPDTMSSVLTQLNTIEPKVALTFNGLARQSEMEKLVGQLDSLNIKATFFIQGMKIRTEPELIRYLLDRGHAVENNTLNHVLVDGLSYEELYQELFLTNRALEEGFAITPAYVRSRSGDSSEAFNYAAAALDLQVVSSSINPRDADMQSAEEIAAYVDRFLTRGSIIQLNTYLNPAVIEAIPLIYQAATNKGLTLTTLADLEKAALPVSTEDFSNKLSEKSDYEAVKPVVIDHFQTDERVLSLTFDDYASEATTVALLDILDQYNIKATFFFIGRGLAPNPQLARLIYSHGHGVANHSYSHQVVTTLTAEELQKDVIKNDQLIAQAIQAKPLNYFRPPQGLIDDERAKIIQTTGVDYIILYDVASWDWNMDISSDDVFNRVIERTGPGSIITMHLMDDAHTLDVLPRILDHYLAAGYRFLTLEEMITDYKEGGERYE